MTDFKDWPKEAQDHLLADIQPTTTSQPTHYLPLRITFDESNHGAIGYDRVRALQRILRRRYIVSRVLLSLAVGLIVCGFVFTVTMPLLGIPMLVAAGFCVLLGKTQ